MLPRFKCLRLALASAASATVALALTASPAAALSLAPGAGDPGVSDSNTLFWIVLVVIVVLVAAINLAILAAIRGSRRRQGERPAQSTGSRSKQVRIASALAVLAIALFVVGAAFSHSSRQTPASETHVPGVAAGQPLDIEVTGQQWLWRFVYPNGAFSYRDLVVPAGATVALHMRSADVIHNWNIPGLTGKAEVVPGKTTTVYFRADPGTYTGYAATLSGQSYAAMSSQVEAVPAALYESRIAQMKSDIQAAQDHVEKQITSNQIP